MGISRWEFSDEDRLRLLQLMTRRAIADRRGRISTLDNGSDADLVEESGAAKPAAIPDRWQLIPEGISLYDWQRECLPLWLSKGRGTVKVATGGGKTRFALAAAQQLQNERELGLRLAVTVPTIPLMFQWYDEIRLGNLPDTAIGLLGGGQELPPLSRLRVLICVLNSAREKLPTIVKKARWARRMLLVVDECHRANAEQARRIFDAKPSYTLGLSATPEQDSEADGLPTDEAYATSFVGQALGPIIYDFTLGESLAAGLLTPFEVWHVGLPLSPSEACEHAQLSREIAELRKRLQLHHQKSRSRQGFLAWCQTQKSRGGTFARQAESFLDLANRRKRLLYQAEARTRITLDILADAVSDPEGRAIVFHESIEDIEALFMLAVERRLPVALEHSRLPDSLRAEGIEAFRRGLARVIISAKSLVEGFNVPSADLGIIAASSSSVRQRIQSLGRMLRRKSADRGARIIVLYVRDTEDEAIYEKADWEAVIGAERNRYFVWNAERCDEGWSSGLQQARTPPRIYRVPSWEVDASLLCQGDPYPGQPFGTDLKVDHSENLRTADGSLVPTETDLIEGILKLNPHRRARCTPAGHLIVRVDRMGSKEADWRFVGVISLPEESTFATDNAVRFRVKMSSGRRVIAREDERQRGSLQFALGPETGGSPEGGQARDQLLQWIKDLELQRGFTVGDLFWDGESDYWVEIGGERILYETPLPALEFRT